MAKMFKKLLATALTLAILATLCAVPMTASAEETFEDYDVVTYADFLDTGNHHLSEDGATFTAKNTLLHYDVTSETHSVIYKFSLVLGTVTYFQMYPGEYGEDPFQYRINVQDDQWVKRYAPANETKSIGYDIKEGDELDIEIARLKVATGENAGKYLTYFKVDGKNIFGKIYVSESQINSKSLGDSIQFATNSDGASYTIKATPEEVEEPTPEEPVDPNPDALYYDYDELTYNDLIADGSNLTASEYPMNNKTFTYNQTSTTGSVIVKYRWKGANAGSEFQLGLDNEGKFAYMFGVQYYKPNAEYPNGRVWLRPGYGPSVALEEAIENGKDYDIEFARLKVKNGENAGKYYLYFKLNDELLAEDYVDGSVVDANGNYTSSPSSMNCTISNKIYLTFWGGGGGNKISAIPVPETYDNYDEVTYDMLTYTGSGSTYTYNATSTSFSSVIKFRWTAGGDEKKFTLFLDDWVYPFCFAAKTPNQTGFGATAGPNGSWHLVPSKDSYIVNMDTPIVDGQSYDIEIARLKVLTGANAGKYYVYAKVNGELIKDYYYDGVVDGVYSGTALSNKVIITAPAGNTLSAIPVPETYEEYDEIGFEDLKDANGNTLGDKKQMVGSNVFTYDQKSATSSVIFKYRWKIGEIAKFQMSFDKSANSAMSYMFGAWLAAPGEEKDFPNGRLWLRPAYGPQIKLEEALAPGSSHDIEFARLKVKTGSNKGKYYVYIKVDGVLLGESYVDANVVDANGNYSSNSTTVSLSNEIFFAFWGSNGNIITSYGKEIADTNGDFDFNGSVNATDLVNLKKIVFSSEALSEKEFAIADFNDDGVLDIRDLVAMKKNLVG